MLDFPDDKTILAAREVVRAVRSHRDQNVQIQVSSSRNWGSRGEPETVLTLPKAAADGLLQILSQMAAGNTVTIVPVHAELTTQQAADLLNVSRPHIINLIERGDLRCHKIGTHRRIVAADLIAYKQASRERSKKAMEELVAESEAMGLYDGDQMMPGVK